MPITFNDRTEALEYQKQMLDENTETYIIQKSNKYIVHTLGKVHNPQIKVVQLDTPTTEHGNIAEWDSDAGEIRYGRKATSTYKAHEAGHAKLGHKMLSSRENSARRDAETEIDAQIYAYTKMGRPINYKVAVTAIRVLDQDYKLSPKRITYLLKSVLESRGIELPHEKEEYWINEYLVD